MTRTLPQSRVTDQPTLTDNKSFHTLKKIKIKYREIDKIRTHIAWKSFEGFAIIILPLEFVWPHLAAHFLILALNALCSRKKAF